MEITGVLDRTPRAAASASGAPDPVVVLDGLVSTLVSLESAIAGLQAMREYTLALASRVAEAMNDDGVPGLGAAAGSWDSRSAELAERAVAAEIATAIRMNDRTVQRQMGQAVELVDRFPATFAALAAGRISLSHARIIQDTGTPLNDPAMLARYETAVVPYAEQHAPARLRRVAAREAEKAQPEALTARHERAVTGRRVRVHPLPDGMAELAATLPAAVAHGIHDRLTHMATTHAGLAAAEQTAAAGYTAESTSHGQNPDQSRTMDQLRADLFADLLLRGAPTAHDTPDGLLAAITARVDITVPVLTLIDSDGPGSGKHHSPAELNGRHPIDPGTARILAGQVTGWSRVLTEPITGAVPAVNR